MPYLEKGLYHEAIAEYERIKGPDGPPWQLAYAYARAGETGRARQLLEKLERRPANSHPSEFFKRATIYVSVGEHEKALADLERLHAARFIAITWLKVSPAFDPLRTDPRFQDLLRRLALD